jgi:hypothetical protein
MRLYWATNQNQPRDDPTARGRVLHFARSDDPRLTLCNNKIVEECDDPVVLRNRGVCKNCESLMFKPEFKGQTDRRKK